MCKCGRLKKFRWVAHFFLFNTLFADFCCLFIWFSLHKCHSLFESTKSTQLINNVKFIQFLRNSHAKLNSFSFNIVYESGSFSFFVFPVKLAAQCPNQDFYFPHSRDRFVILNEWIIVWLVIVWEFRKTPNKNIYLQYLLVFWHCFNLSFLCCTFRFPKCLCSNKILDFYSIRWIVWMSK